MHTKRFITFFKRWVQFLLGAIPCLPYFLRMKCKHICLTVMAPLKLINSDSRVLELNPVPTLLTTSIAWLF